MNDPAYDTAVLGPIRRDRKLRRRRRTCGFGEARGSACSSREVAAASRVGFQPVSRADQAIPSIQGHGNPIRALLGAWTGGDQCRASGREGDEVAAGTGR